MANEAVLIYETHLPIPMTVANATGIEKGTVLKLADPLTASAQTALNDIVAGICATEKIASDGLTKTAVYRGGIFKMTASGSITVGDPVVTATANKVVTSAVNEENVLGIALETATDGETLLVELRPTRMQLA